MEEDAPKSKRSLLLPLAFAQFLCSYAASNMNVAINDIAKDLNTNVAGVQTTITLFTLVMAAFMIPGSKLTDILGRKRCFRIGLITYGIGTLIAALSPSILIMTLGYSLFEGIGTALLIPPVYILVTVSFNALKDRAKAFGVISGMAGIGSATGPLIGGIITTSLSWRVAFLLQTLMVVIILFLSRKIEDPGITGAKPKFDFLGTILSALGLILIVIGILQADTYGFFTAREDFAIAGNVIIQEGGISPIWLFIGSGVAILGAFFWYINSQEKQGKQPLLSPKILQNRTSNLGLVTQNLQWLILQGSSFVISVFLQTVRGFSAIATGLSFVPATVGILLSSALAGRFSQKYPQNTLIRAGFAITTGGLALLLILANITSDVWILIPSLFLLGFGVGLMLTSSVNVVQSSFPESQQGEISGLSRSVSNLGSSLGTAIVGTVLVSASTIGNDSYKNALITMVIFASIGFIVALLLPSTKKPDQNGKK